MKGLPFVVNTRPFSNCMIALLVKDFPLPLSPISPSVFPSSTSKPIFFTSSSRVARAVIFKLSTFSISALPRVADVAQRFAEQIEARSRKQNAQPRVCDQFGVCEDEFICIYHHSSPFGGACLQSQAQKGVRPLTSVQVRGSPAVCAVFYEA